MPDKPNFGDVNARGAMNSATPRADFSDVTSSSSSEAMTSAEAARPAEQSYTVVGGDSLSKIAKHFYGDATKWKTVWNANKDQISNPDLIQIGQVLRIPTL